MPLFVVRTSVALSDDQIAEISTGLTKQCAALTGKPEAVFMVEVQASQKIMFALSAAPSTHVAVNIVGDPGHAGNDAITQMISSVLAPHGITADRTFVTVQVFEESHWGWNNQTLATKFGKK